MKAAREAEQARKAEEAQKEEEQKAVEKAAKTPEWRAGSPVTRDDEDENPWATFRLGSQAELDAKLEAETKAAEEADKKAEKQAVELEAAKFLKAKKIERFYSDLRRHAKNAKELENAKGNVAIDEKSAKMERFYAMLRSYKAGDPPLFMFPLG